jgi:glutamyl-tRNA reductase
MRRLFLLGLSHATAPLEVRERLAFDAEQRRSAAAAFRGQFPDCELVLLSTCNRVELYAARAVHGRPRAEELIAFVSGIRAVPEGVFAKNLYQKTDRAVVEHLFNVACSLDSMVLGETQILGQVREAYDAASQLNLAGAVLHPLFQRALAVGKQVMSDTPLAEGRLSVASVAVDYARRIFDRFTDKTVLSIGAGKMSALVLRHFAELSPKKLLICNRDPAKSALLAEQFGGSPAPFDDLLESLAAADIVVSSTASRQPIISRDLFAAVMKRRHFKPVFLIDLAVPRDIEASVGGLSNVYLYNLDDLQGVAAGSRSQRREAVDRAGQIVAAGVEEFVRWHRARDLGPLIDQLYQRYHALAEAELQRTLAKLPGIAEAEKEHLRELTRRIVNKLLHDPVRQLRESGEMHGPAAQYLHALEKLFNLEGPAPIARDDAHTHDSPTKE